MTYYEIISKAAKELELPRTFVDRVYKSYWKAIREHVSSLPMLQDLTDEEFLALRPNVNIPSIGKLYVTLDRYRRMKKYERIKNEKLKEYVAHKKD
jgi:hypothetical protein